MKAEEARAIAQNEYDKINPKIPEITIDDVMKDIKEQCAAGYFHHHSKYLNIDIISNLKKWAIIFQLAIKAYQSEDFR